MTTTTLPQERTSTSTPSPPTTKEIKFLTFNTWGLKYVSKLRKERLSAISDRIATDHAKYDVIALQEVWVREDWDYLESTCSQWYPYRRIFYSGILTGPGLAILSKVPIESTFLYRFPINGRPSAFWRGDWYVGKSVGVTLLRPLSEDTPPLAILNSHMHAPYSLTGDAAYECHRSCQAWDFSRLSSLLTKAGYAVVIVGDLNSRPGSLPHSLLTLETGLVDSWEQLNGVQDLEYIKNLPAEAQIEIGGTTCDSILNTWRANRHPTEACRLDYALIDGTKLQTVQAKVEFTETLAKVGSYSDHFAYSCTLQVLTKGGDSSYQQAQLQDNDAYKHSRVMIHDDLLKCIELYESTSAWQTTWRSFHFWISVVLIIGIVASTTLTSNLAAWSSIFWILATVVVVSTGLIDGLIALLFGRSEWRALQEVKHEVLNSKRSLTSMF